MFDWKILLHRVGAALGGALLLDWQQGLFANLGQMDADKAILASLAAALLGALGYDQIVYHSTKNK